MRELNHDVVASAKLFLSRLVSYAGAAGRDELQPIGNSTEDRARQVCTRRGYARWDKPYWRITDLGRKVVDGLRVF